MKRLVASQNRFSRPTILLKYFMDKSGHCYQYNARLLNVNHIFYSITREDKFGNVSLYDGTSFDDSFEFFCELMLALKGVNIAEEFAKTKTYLQQNAQKLIPEKVDISLKYKPVYLGDSEQIRG